MSCQAENVGGTAESSAEVVVRKKEYAPRFIQKLEPVTARPNERVEISIDVIGTPKPEVEWFLNNQRLVQSNRIKFFNRGGVFTIKFLKAEVRSSVLNTVTLKHKAIFRYQTVAR